MRLTLSYEVPYSAVNVKHFKGSMSGNPVIGGNELLGNDGFYYAGQLNPYLLLLMRRKYIDQSVYGIGCSDGVNR